MKIKIKHFNALRKGPLQKVASVDLPEGGTVKNLLLNLSINLNEVGVLMINSKPGTFDQELREGDIVMVIPHIGGG